MICNKKISCGVLIIQDDKILMCHVTGKDFWDLPKGCKNSNESEISAAIRELYEETSITVEACDLLDLGNIEYTHEKNLHLFLYTGKKQFKLVDMKCISFFKNKNTNTFLPEVDAFDFFDLDQAFDKCFYSMKAVLNIHRLYIEKTEKLSPKVVV